MNLKRLGTALLCAAVLSACTGESDSPEESQRGTLTIYSSLPLQGDSKPQSEDIVHAMEMALADHNGEAAGYTIEYVSLDDADPSLGFWESDKVEANARRAADDPRTIAYLGEFNSPATTFSLPILNEAGILQVSPSNTYVGLTRSEGALPGEPDIFYPTGERTYGRVIPADHVQAGALVTYMKDEGCTNVFILNDGDIYGKGIADQVERNAEAQGLDVLGNETIDREAKNFRRLAGDVKDASAKCFLFGGVTQSRAVEVTKAVAGAVPGIKMFFPDACAEAAFTQEFDDEVARQIFITNPTLDTGSYPSAGQEFIDDFRAEYGGDPEPYAIYGYEAMSLVLDSIERAGDDAAATPEGRRAVVGAFFETQDRESVLGTYDIDPYGDTTLSAYGAYGVEDGGLFFDSVIDVVIAEPTDGPELTPAPESTAEATTPLEGTWRGEKVTFAMLSKERTEKEARAVFNANGARSHLVTSLELRGDSWLVLISVDGGSEEFAQTGTFTVEDDLIRMTEGAVTYTYRYQLRGDTLKIELVKSNAAPNPQGISDDAFQVAHFATPFTKVD